MTNSFSVSANNLNFSPSSVYIPYRIYAVEVKLKTITSVLRDLESVKSYQGGLNIGLCSCI